MDMVKVKDKPRIQKETLLTAEAVLIVHTLGTDSHLNQKS